MAVLCVYRARYFNTVAGPFVGRLAYTTQSVRTVSERRRLNCSESPRTASFPGKRSRPRRKAVRSPLRNLPRNTRLRTRTGRKKSSRPAIQRLSSGASPPPVTTQWTWGCSVRFWPQVCSTASTPTSAPRYFGLVAVQELLRPCPDYNDLAPLANRLMEVRSYGKGEPPAVPPLLRVLDLPTTSSECLGSGAPPDQPPRGRHRRMRPTASRRFSRATTRSRRHHPAGTDHGTGSPYHRPRPARTATARSAAVRPRPALRRRAALR